MDLGTSSNSFIFHGLHMGMLPSIQTIGFQYKSNTDAMFYESQRVVYSDLSSNHRQCSTQGSNHRQTALKLDNP